jgi:hypothetical protein
MNRERSKSKFLSQSTNDEYVLSVDKTESKREMKRNPEADCGF